ncbi:MAG: glycoside hydrolase family 25 protein [Actinomycetia bacterium]|nr:glycoside hydrolase family 25 protein [Actinomycetes bacterium]
MPAGRRVIDVSENNGTATWLPIDWAQVVASRQVEGVYVRASLGALRADQAFSRNWAALRRSPLLQGIYVYALPGATPNVTAHAQHQAQFVWGILRQNGGPHQDDLPPMLDVEVTGGLAPATLQAWTAAALAELSALAGKPAVLYSDEWFLVTYLKPLLAQHPIWIAAYQAQCPSLPGAHVVAWQFSPRGRIPGIHTPVDCDEWYGPWPAATGR